MSYILDQKRNLGSIVIPTGLTNKVSVFSEFTIKPSEVLDSYVDVNLDGSIKIGGQNNTILATGLLYNFKQINDPVSDYLLKNEDYAIEIINDAIFTVTLPAAFGAGGKTYIVSRGSNNNDLRIKTQIGESIDGSASITFRTKNTHMKIMSNSIDRWYII